MTTVRSPTATSTNFAGVIALLLGAAVAVGLGVYGRVHTPSGEAFATFGFGSMIAMKVWLGSAAGVLALVQLFTAVGIYTRGGRALALGHRTSGTLAVLLSLPVAYQCLWSLGFADYDIRVLVHSLAGCLVYGALVTKLLSLHAPRMPSWLVPVAGSLLLTAVVTAALTSSVWYFAEVGVP
ncbi:MAG TPA: DUF6529 family protein [Nocardioidaceae bacterium]|nr:DUF6529 family protein [Nocardioidaceae bacterium]